MKRYDFQVGLPPVELVEVFEWVCTNCGLQQVARPMRQHFTDEEARNHLEIMDGDPAIPMDGVWFKVPEVVQCAHCKTKHAARDVESEPFDDETP